MRVAHLAGLAADRGAETFAGDLAKALSALGTTQLIGYGEKPFAALRAWHPDVIQAHGGGTLTRAVMASIDSRVHARLVYRRIGSVHHLVRQFERRAAYGWLMRRADCVVAVSDVVRRETIEFFRLRPERVVTIPNGVDPDRLVPSVGREAMRDALGIPIGAPVVLSLGALTWEKDPLAHLEVAVQVLREVPNVVHLFAGDGPLRERLEYTILEQGLTRSIQVLGSRPDVGDLLAASDMMLLASRTEGMPGCLIEAGMVGLPVAAYAVAGVPEVVEDGATGLLVSPGDVGELGRSVVKLMRNAELQRSMGAAAAVRCCDQFNIRLIATRYLRLYERLTRE